MIQSMTGFGSHEVIVPSLGRVSVELRSTNHKFLETALHLPEGSLALEDKIKKAIEAKVKRGRVAASVNLSARRAGNVFINKELLKKYLSKIDGIKKEFRIEDRLNINTLIHLPGVLALEEEKVSPESVWPKLKIAIDAAIDKLVATRLKEGKALQGYLKKQADELKSGLEAIKLRLKTAIREKLRSLPCDEDRASFLKDTDTTEEIDRLKFHIQNFKNKLIQGGSVGKELDFIAQEMQREANTLAAKTFDISVTSQVLQMKSLIEKIREQAQNIE